MENKERRGLFKITQEVLVGLFDQNEGPRIISAHLMDEATDQITYHDGNGEQVIRVSEEEPNS